LVETLDVLGGRGEHEDQGAKAFLFPQLKEAGQRLIGTITEEKNYSGPGREQLVDHVKSATHASESAQIR
jgi:hypothetical protein